MIESNLTKSLFEVWSSTPRGYPRLLANTVPRILARNRYLTTKDYLHRLTRTRDNPPRRAALREMTIRHAHQVRQLVHMRQLRRSDRRCKPTLSSHFGTSCCMQA
jgi:hypothetical protein